MRAVLIIAILLLSGCASIPNSEPADAPDAKEPPMIDPYELGNLTSTLIPFDMGQRVIMAAEGAYLLHVRGETTMPIGDGAFPVVIIMHGRHGTCTTPLGERLLQPCPDTPATASVRSYTGYRYLAEYLASHGIASVSIDANNVNDRDNDYTIIGDDYGATARANLIFEVVAELETGEVFDSLRPDINIGNIGLMGHSRGGEGVIRAGNMDAQRFTAIFALAPTDFEYWVLDGVPFATILPYCDGDVSSLHGARTYDNHAEGPKHQFLHMGSNHNYYNTIWTNTDWGSRGDPYCDEGVPTSGRLSPEDQRNEGMAIMGSFMRYYLAGHDDLLPLLAGATPFPADVKVSYPSGESMLEEGTYQLPWDYEGPTLAQCSGNGCPLPQTLSITDQWYVELDGEARWSSPFPVGWAIDSMTIRLGLHPETAPSTLDGFKFFFAGGDEEIQVPLVDAGAFIPPGQGAAKVVLSNVFIAMPPAVLDWDTVDSWGFFAKEPIEFQFTDWHYQTRGATISPAS